LRRNTEAGEEVEDEEAEGTGVEVVEVIVVS
jgi:hypothetical protein